MSAENLETTKLVVCVKPNHPAGRRNRAWFTFTDIPTVVEVTAEQEKIIREDQFLRIIEKGTAYEDAMSAYNKKSNPKPQENASEWSEDQKPDETSSDTSNANPDAIGDENSADPKDPETKDPADIPPSDEWSKDPEDQKPAKPISRMNKEELIAGLEAKWLKAGEGFDPNASNKDLAALLSSL